MPAHVVVELDVTPPQFTIITAFRVDDQVAVRYELNEPQLVSAEIAGVPPTSVTADTLIFDGVPFSGALDVVVRDEVDNEAVLHLSFNANFQRTIGRAVRAVWGAIKSGAQGVVRRGRDGFIARGNHDRR